MHIFIHWLEFSHNLRCSDKDVAWYTMQQELCPLLGINQAALSGFMTKKNTFIITLQLHGKEVFSMSFPQHSYGTMTLKGGLFDAVQMVDIPGLWSWVRKHGGNCKRQDISFLDTSRIINFNEYRRMSRAANYKQFCTGSCFISRKRLKPDPNKPYDPNNRQGMPDCHADAPVIHYGDADTDYAKLYKRPDGKSKFEITIVNKDHNAALLNLYDTFSSELWEENAKSVLVQMLNFVNPGTNTRIKSWERFLGSEVEPIVWSRLPNMPTVEPKTFEQQLTWHIGRVQNFLYRSGLGNFQGQIEDLAAELRMAHAIATS